MAYNENLPSPIVTCYGRLSYPALIKPRGYKEGDDLFFQASLLIPKIEVLGQERFDGKPYSPWGVEKGKLVHDIEPLRKFVLAAEQALFPAVAGKKGGTKSPFFDGDKPRNDEDEANETHVGHFWFRTKSKKRPVLLRADKSLGEVTDEEEIRNLFVPGYWVRLQVAAYDATNNKPGVGFGLRMVQLVRQDNAFSGDGGKVDVASLPDLPAEDIKAAEDLGDME